MCPIFIADRETNQLVRELAKSRGSGLTEAIRDAVKIALAHSGEGSVEASPAEGDRDGGDCESLLRDLETVIRSTTLEYTRLLAKSKGTKSVGSRVYQMLARHGAVETLRRLVERPTEGLDFLNSVGRLDLSAEEISLTPMFEPIVPADIKARARANLAKFRAGPKTG